MLYYIIILYTLYFEISFENLDITKYMFKLKVRCTTMKVNN